VASSDATWHVYLLRCADDTLYCGVTTDLDRRLAQHNGRLPGGARYTRPRRPVALLLSRACTSRQEALRLEYHIKRLPRSRKEQALKEFPQCCPWILS
jgi:putative endonuclease